MSIFSRTRRLDVRLLHVVILIVAGAGLALPAILYGFPPQAHDGPTTVIYYTHFAQQLWAGELYPRWMFSMNAGLGSPIFFYYPPVPYYLTSLLHPLFTNDPQGWWQTGLSAAIAMITSGLCLYLWLYRHTYPWAALLAAVVYMAMPYHTGDLFYRGGFNEFWAFVWMPLVLYFVDRIVEGRERAVIALALGYALLVLTHLLTTMIFSLIPLAYACYMAERGRRMRVTGRVIIGLSLGMGLSALFWLPALAMQKYIFLEEGTQGHFYYALWFMFKLFDWKGEMADVFWTIPATLAVAGCVLYLVLSKEGGRLKKQGVFWAVTALCSTFMMTPLSKPVWQVVSVLQILQFAWRFNTILTLAAAALVAVAFSSIKKSHFVSLILAASIGVICFLSFERMIHSWSAYFKATPQEELSRRQLWLEQQRDHFVYRPRWVQSMYPDDIEALRDRIGRTNEGLTKVRIIEGTGRAEVKQWKSKEIILDVDSQGGASLQVSHFYFPGWTARLAGEARALTIQPTPDGLVSIAVPAGRQEVRLRRRLLAVEYAGLITSALALLVTLFLMARMFIRRESPSSQSKV